MGRGRSELTTWLKTERPQTPLQKGNYIDVCTRYLVDKPDEEESSSEKMSTSVDPIDMRPKEQLFVYTESELNVIETDTCAFCDAPWCRMVVANPFSQRCYMLLCARCDSK